MFNEACNMSTEAWKRSEGAHLAAYINLEVRCDIRVIHFFSAVGKPTWQHTCDCASYCPLPTPEPRDSFNVVPDCPEHRSGTESTDAGNPHARHVVGGTRRQNYKRSSTLRAGLGPMGLLANNVPSVLSRH
jgi:hypothetical protein